MSHLPYRIKNGHFFTFLAVCAGSALVLLCLGLERRKTAQADAQAKKDRAAAEMILSETLPLWSADCLAHVECDL